MVGDWVYQAQFVDLADPNLGHGWKPVKVTSIPFDKDCFIEPIPLTAKILENNGFKRWKNDNPCLIYEFKQSEECISVCVYFPKGYNTRYYKNWASVSNNENNIEHCVCEYVHELQHALKLCGIEKEIELKEIEL